MLELVGNMLSLDIAVARSVLPVAEVPAIKRVLEKRYRPPLSLDFPLADLTHPSFPLLSNDLPWRDRSVQGDPSVSAYRSATRFPLP